LTIDWRLQDIVESELTSAVSKYNAKSGMAVFLDCHTGDILAAAHFDPAERFPERPAKLRAISDQFEPGSVFKMFTAAALLDANLVNFQDSVFCEEGKWKLGRRTLHDDKELGWLNFRQVVEFSSNIGIAKFAMNMPPEELFDVYRKFGFGQKLRCGLPGEAAGSLNKPQPWSEYNIAALTMGHSVATTPLQLAAAIAAVANGGTLMRPRILLGYIEPDGGLVRESESQEICRVFEESISDSLRSILRGVVERGTAKVINSEVIKIAGKTGTAEIPDLINGGYHKNHFSASFGGFFPYDRPIIAGLVVLEDPRPITYGGYTAGKAFKQIAEEYSVINPDAFILRDRTLFASNDRLDNTVEVPNLVGRDVHLAIELAEKNGVKLRASATEGVVTWQFPPADRVLFAGDELIVSVAQTEAKEQPMADLRGLPIRTVAAFLHHIGIDYRIEGVGTVVNQSIKPGTIVSPGSASCRLVCKAT
jgi:cell division protein FtsI (penicillin-binding protein 3)